MTQATLSRPGTPGWKTAITEICTWLYGPVSAVQATGMQTYTCVLAEGNEVYVRLDDSAPGHTTIDLYSPEDELAMEPSLV
jgi:hypothetical protein